MRCGPASTKCNGEVSAMHALSLKLWRELWQLKGQMLSIALVVATGTMTVVTMRGSYDSLVQAQQAYYRETRFAQIWAPLKRAPESMRTAVATLPGVTAVDTRVVGAASLDLPGLDAPAQGLFISLPERGRPRLNDIRLDQGRYIAAGHPDEIIVNQKFAQARRLGPGDALQAIINGRSRRLSIVGVANSPEYAYALPPGSLFPENDRFAVVWMGRRALEAAWNMDGAFNEIVVTLAPAASEAATIAALNRLLAPYGGTGAYARSQQMSHQILQGELDQNKVMGTAIPAAFLLVAAFLLNLVLGRLITTQRAEIALLKAFGYRDREVGAHYLMFAMVAVLAGAALGLATGIALGHGYIAIYAQYFSFPALSFALQPALALVAVLVSVAAACAGSLSAVRRAASLPPAEAMRAEPPASFEAGWLERSGIAARLAAAVRMILRNLGRKPLQLVLSSVGVAFSVAILVVGLFMFDGVRYMMDMQFRQIQREDLSVSFNESLDAAARFDLAHLPGVSHVEVFRSVPARLVAGHREQSVAIQGLSADSRLRRIVSADGSISPVPISGAVLSATLARRLQLSPGDLVEVQVLEGRRAVGQIHVAGVVEDFLGLSVTMSRPALARLVGGPEMISGAFLSVDQHERHALEKTLKQLPTVAAIASPAATLASFEEQLGDSLFISIGFLLGFAGVIAVGVVYNGARIALSERSRELASLRVMGFRRSEVTVLLLGEQAIITALAIPLGWGLGYLLARAISAGVQTDAYRIPFMISASTYGTAALVVMLTAALSAAIVRRRIDRFDLIAVLKTRE